MASLSVEKFVSILDDPVNPGIDQSQRSTKVMAVRDLLTQRQGTVEEAASVWIEGVKTIAEPLFNITLPEDPVLELGRYAIYQPTVFEGVHGRFIAHMIDEIMGPGFRLDITAEPLNDIPQGPEHWPLTQGLFFDIYIKPRLK